MNQSISATSTSIGSDVGGGSATVWEKAGSLAGRVVTLIKTQVEAFLPYLQNPYYAGATLFVFHLVTLPLASKIGDFVVRWLPQATEGQAKFRQFMSYSIATGLWVSSTVAFVHYTGLALSAPIIGLISAAAVLILANLYQTQ